MVYYIFIVNTYFSNEKLCVKFYSMSCLPEFLPVLFTKKFQAALETCLHSKGHEECVISFLYGNSDQIRPEFEAIDKELEYLAHSYDETSLVDNRMTKLVDQKSYIYKKEDYEAYSNVIKSIPDAKMEDLNQNMVDKHFNCLSPYISAIVQGHQGGFCYTWCQPDKFMDWFGSFFFTAVKSREDCLLCIHQRVYKIAQDLKLANPPLFMVHSSLVPEDIKPYTETVDKTDLDLLSNVEKVLKEASDLNMKASIQEDEEKTIHDEMKSLMTSLEGEKLRTLKKLEDDFDDQLKEIQQKTQTILDSCRGAEDNLMEKKDSHKQEIIDLIKSFNQISGLKFSVETLSEDFDALKRKRAENELQLQEIEKKLSKFTDESNNLSLMTNSIAQSITEMSSDMLLLQNELDAAINEEMKAKSELDGLYEKKRRIKEYTDGSETFQRIILGVFALIGLIVLLLIGKLGYSRYLFMLNSRKQN